MYLNSFLTPDNEKWAEILKSVRHDFYHLPEYVALEADWLKAKPIAFYCEYESEIMLLPLIERSTPYGFGSDAVTPYGYSSPIFSDCSTEKFRINALQCFQDAAQQRGLVSSFIRLHPLIQPSLLGGDKLLRGIWLQDERGFTVDLPLDADHDSWLSSISSGHRGDIKRLKSNGYRFVMNTEKIMREFPRIYAQTMQRLNAKSEYQYTSEYFDRIHKALGDKLQCAAVLNADGDLMCAALFTHVNDVVQYHLSATDERFAKMAPMKLVISEMREWARQRSVLYFHLGGGLGGGKDSLFYFKEKFGGQTRLFRTVSAIHISEIYEKECQSRASLDGSADSTINGFFPAYRAPVRLT
ncbi:hypothetical protein B9Z51_06520 [Limnohabitans sp. T6-5]|uniref:GNAT family N-acetyltransferase n=1 Tax=Limnohabitans sp. T6-5 TaxID=1100724 RepID=UPI000D37334A|nr:GNAT family N-acetyltransferase [Limnohabitans sp. T6-5]PUE08605.1 hypothetical protein B9Z51_06520 [Limnohabitans sp. T6-5]